MDRSFPPRWLVPDWVRLADAKEPFFLQQAAYFSLYAPFVLLLITAIVAYATYASPEWRHFAAVVWIISGPLTFVAGLVLGVMAFIGGVQRRRVMIYVCTFWGCFFNGTLLVLLVLGILAKLSNCCF